MYNPMYIKRAEILNVEDDSVGFVNHYQIFITCENLINKTLAPRQLFIQLEKYVNLHLR